MPGKLARLSACLYPPLTAILALLAWAESGWPPLTTCQKPSNLSGSNVPEETRVAWILGDEATWAQ